MKKVKIHYINEKGLTSVYFKDYSSLLINIQDSVSPKFELLQDIATILHF